MAIIKDGQVSSNISQDKGRINETLASYPGPKIENCQNTGTDYAKNPYPGQSKPVKG